MPPRIAPLGQVVLVAAVKTLEDGDPHGLLAGLILMASLSSPSAAQRCDGGGSVGGS